MQCEFENAPCAISGNFICKKCKTCGHQIGMAASVADTQWGQIRARLEANCPNKLGQSVPAATNTAATTPAAEDNGVGPGAQLKKYLSRIGIKASPTCSCNARAKYMDFMGVTWCEQNIDTIVGWLKEEASKRKLPFIEIGARALVRRAIAFSKKAQNIK